MPRKSAAHLSVVPATAAEPITRIVRVRAPDYLSATARSEFLDIVGTTAADHWRPSDVPLLARYCELCALARAPEIDVATYLQICRTMALLATRLRLAPSTRGHHRTTARQKMEGRSWEADLDE
jgi:hypothetical protein